MSADFCIAICAQGHHTKCATVNDIYYVILKVVLQRLLSAVTLTLPSFTFADFSGDSTSLSEFPPVEERSGPEGAEEDCPDSSQRHGHLNTWTDHTDKT